MLSTFATTREPALVQGTAAALPNNGGTASGSVGVAVPLSLLPLGGCVAATAGCVDVRRNACFPETLTITFSFGHDEHGGWDHRNIGANFPWRLKLLPQ